jgi:hypothetical protein
MQEFRQQDQQRSPPSDTAGVTYFASQVVSLLAERSAKAGSDLREPMVAGLIQASLSGTKDAFAELLTEVRRSRITLAALADLYIPEAARRMGHSWHEDELSWMDVTIGVGRLQSLLREIGTAWVADQAGDTGSGTVLLLLPDREQHTLGPMVAVGQMRRYGVSVCLRIAPTFEELRNLVTKRRFDGILISVATKDKLDPVGRTIKYLRTVMTDPCPIIVGGAVMARVEDPAACTGADLSSNDIGAALEAIGLKFDASCVLRRA